MADTIITGALLFDGHSFHPDSTITFSSGSGLIVSVSKDPFDRSSAPAEATIIDGTGHTLIPGLIEGHLHAWNLHLPPGADHSQVLKRPLKCGITTVCDMFSDLETISDLRAQISEDWKKARSTGGNVTMSDLKTALHAATIADGWPKPIVLSHEPSKETIEKVTKWPNLKPSDAPAFIKTNKSLGADYIKLMQENCCSLAIPTNSVPSASLELQTAVVEAAHEQGMLVLAHATSIESTEIVLKAGVDGLAHTFLDQAPTDDIIDLYKKTNAFVIPTLAVHASLADEAGELRQKFADIATKKGLLDDFNRENMLEAIGLKAETAKLEYAYESIRRLRKAGIDVVAGTDSVAGLKGTAIGPSLWMELEMYVTKCGMSAEAALASATGVSSDRFRFNDRGKIEKGRRGDLVLVSGDLSQGIEKLWEGKGIVGVWKEGIRAV